MRKGGAGLVWLLVVLLPAAAWSGLNTEVLPLPCGIYDEMTRPLVQRALRTTGRDRADCTMEAATKSGRELRVEVRHVSIAMPGERNQVSVFLDGKPFVKTSHQDVPIYVEVHVDEAKYRIICVRAHPEDGGEDLTPGGIPPAPACGLQSGGSATTAPGAGQGIETAPTGTKQFLP